MDLNNKWYANATSYRGKQVSLDPKSYEYGQMVALSFCALPEYPNTSSQLLIWLMCDHSHPNLTNFRRISATSFIRSLTCVRRKLNIIPNCPTFLTRNGYRISGHS